MSGEEQFKHFVVEYVNDQLIQVRLPSESSLWQDYVVVDYIEDSMKGIWGVLAWTDNDQWGQEDMIWFFSPYDVQKPFSRDEIDKTIGEIKMIEREAEEIWKMENEDE